MALTFHENELMELMKDFHTLTGIRIILFDEAYNELMAYPPKEKNFCFCLRENPLFDKKCRKSDEASFRKCKETNQIHIFECHAGLSEATAPVIENGHIIGYMMFGQVTNEKNKEAFTEKMNALCKQYQIEQDLSHQIRKIKYRNSEQLRAASKLLEAYVHYVRLKDIVHPSGEQLIDSIDAFLEKHLSEEISVDRICSELNVCRTRLYELIQPYTNGGIAAYIKNKRLEHAKNLIQTTELSIPEIAEACGFADYNYFLRLFKKKFGVSSKMFRNKTKQSVSRNVSPEV